MAFEAVQTLFNGAAPFATGANQGSGGNATTLTEVAGANRYLVLEYALGNESAGAPIFASVEVGGQSLGILQQDANAASEGSNDEYIGVSVADEATIAAMTFTDGEADWEIETNGSTDLNFVVRAYWYVDIDQTVGVVDSDADGGTSNPQTLTLATLPLDIVIGLGCVRETTTISSSDTVRGTALTSGSGSSHVESLVSEKEAAGTSTQIDIAVGQGAFSAMVALAFRPAAAGGGAVQADRSTPRGANRGANRGTAYA
jgi:hypothetical protein